MTFNTKKRTRVSENGPPASSSQTDPDSPTLEELLERNEVLERRLRKYKEKQKSTKDMIKPIIRPKGEAGNRKRGFILYSAMGMEKVENGPVVYDRMRDCVRKACIKVGLNLSAHYKHQDPEKLGQVFLLVRKSYPYLSTARFPHNWAIADMVKGYIAGTRKEHKRQTREDEGERSRAREKKPISNTSDVDEPRDDDDVDVDADDQPLTIKKKAAHSSGSKSKKKTRDSDGDEQSDHEDRPRSKRKKTEHPSSQKRKKPSRVNEQDDADEGDGVDYDDDGDDEPISSFNLKSTRASQNCRQSQVDHLDEESD